MFFYLDTLRFNQIFINLIGNAIKFSEPDGLIEITCERADGALVRRACGLSADGRAHAQCAGRAPRGLRPLR